MNRVVVILGMGLLAACGSAAKTSPSASATPSTYTMHVTFVLNDAPSSQAGCQGQGGYSDIGPGTQAVVKDPSDHTIGVGEFLLGTGAGTTSCTFSFDVTGLPKESFYSVTVSHRGTQTYSFDTMQSTGWMVSLTLGS